MEVIDVSTRDAALLALAEEWTESLDATVRRGLHDVVISLSPEDDAVRRLLHALRFDGAPVHLLERPSQQSRTEALEHAAAFATNVLRAHRCVVLQPDDVADRERARPACDDLCVTVQTTSVPGPAHKERQRMRLRPERARSVFIPLHVPMYTTAIRVRLTGLGCALVELDGLRLFRTGRPPVDIDPMLISTFVSGTNAAAWMPAVRALVPDGALELAVHVPPLWERLGRCDAAALRFVAAPVAGGALSRAALRRLATAFADPWHGVERLGRGEPARVPAQPPVLRS